MSFIEFYLISLDLRGTNINAHLHTKKLHLEIPTSTFIQDIKYW